MPESIDPSSLFAKSHAQTRPPRPINGSWWSEEDFDSTTGSEGGGQSVGHGEALHTGVEPEKGWKEHALGSRVVSASQGAYYGVLALWPLISPNTFNMLVFQSDVWLARTLGGLLAVVAISLLFTSRGETRQRAADGCVVGVCTAAVLIAMNIALMAEPTASRLHLLDVGVELGFLIWWGASMLGLPSGEQSQGHFHNLHSRTPIRVEDPPYH